MNWDSGEFRDLDVDALLQAVTASAAEAQIDGDDGELPERVADVQDGSRFKIPLLIPEELESGDGRKMKKDALSTRDLPIPLLWQPQTGSGHDGSYIVGRIDTIERVDGGLGNAYGVFDTGPYGREAERLVRNKMLRGVSADLDQFEATVDGEEVEDMSKISTEKLTVDKARVMAATLVAKPAFQECTIELVNEEEMGDDTQIADGVYEGLPSDEFAMAEVQLSALAASAAPVNPPREWFNNPELSSPTPLTIDDDGRVYGHIATWETNHIAYNTGVRPPRSRSNYAYFRTGLVRTEEGEDVAVGQLTLAGGHAPLDADAHLAVKHYDDTASAVADVAAGEDAFGIWVAGGLRPGVTSEQVRTLRASAPSGDWRPINGTLELVAVCQVNVPGFPVARARVASGAVMALVAAGTTQLARLKTNQLEELAARIDAMEKRELARQKAELASKFAPVQDMRKKRLAEAAQAAREKLAPELSARATMITELNSRAEEARKRIAEFKIGPDLHPGDKNWKEDLHPRDNNGKFRHVLFKLSEILDGATEGDAAPSTDAAKASLERAADLEESGDLDGARRAADEAKVQLDEAMRDSHGDGVTDALGEVASDLARSREELDEPVDNPEEERVESDAPSVDVAPDVDAPDAPMPKSDSGAAPDPEDLGDIPQEIQDLVDMLIDEFGESVDPKTIVSRMDNRLRHWLEGKGFRSPEEMAKVIEHMMLRPIQPDIGQ